MLDGQCAEICPLNGTAIRSHWNVCIGRPEQARKFPGSAGRSVTRGCLCCWQCARKKRGLANHRARADLPPSQKLHKRRRGTEIPWLGLSKQTSAGLSSLHLQNGGAIFEHCTESRVSFVFIKSLKTHPRCT